MIKHYNETWKFYIRQLQLTSRRSDYVPYFMNTSLYEFIKSCDNDILDIGCGENNLKLYFPNIHGVDRTLEADTFAYVNDSKFTELNKFNYGLAVNSLHFGNIYENIERALSKCNKLWISLNENQPIEDFKIIDTWEKFGNVEYFWHGQDPSTKASIRAHLAQDHLYQHLANIDNRTLDNDVEMIYNDTVHRDPYYGVVRVVIERK